MYYVSKMFWLIAAPTNALVLISAIAAFVPGSAALEHLDTAAKKWIGPIAYRLTGKTDALFPAP